MNIISTPEAKTAVIVTDIQGDFTEFRHGLLAVPGTGEDYVRDVERTTLLLKEAGFLILGSQDWHPENHVSFYTSHGGKKPGDRIQIDGISQELWPPHCVAGTENARIVVDNDLFSYVVRKAIYPEFESYSVFQLGGGRETELDDILSGNKVNKVIIYGLATDYCVKYTTLDGLKKGYTFIVLESLCRGITAESASLALQEMDQAGAIILQKLDVEQIKTL
jgi:nicotinamidase/pyrazinamidase